MKKVSILVPESSVMQAIADPQYLFSAVNQFLVVSGKKPLFDVQLVGAKKEVKLNEGKFSVRTDKLLKEVQKTDLVFIPATESLNYTCSYRNNFSNSVKFCSLVYRKNDSKVK